MFGMDIFNNDAFSAVTLTEAIQEVKFVPQYIRSLNLFQPNPVRTTTVAVEKRGNSLALIPTSPRGGPRDRRGRDRRNIRNFEIPRVSREDRVMADAFQNIRAFGSEDMLEAVQEEVMRILSGHLIDHDLTMEYHQLGAIQGLLLDSNGSTIYDYFSEFGISAPTEIAFNFAARTGVAEYIRNNVVRPMKVALGGRWVPGTRILALCGDTAFDALTSNAEVRATYLNWLAAADLRKGLASAYGEFSYGDVEWVNYQGTAAGDVAIASDKIKFVPVGARGVFQVAYAPLEGMEFVNTLGQSIYSRLVPDPTIRQEYVDMEVTNHPLHICTTPEALLTGRSGS